MPKLWGKAMNISLWHGKNISALIVDDVVIEYTRRIHRYESEGDYKTLITELNTYGISSANLWLDYLVTARK